MPSECLSRGIIAKIRTKPNFVGIFSCFVSCFTWNRKLELQLTAYVLLLYLVRKNIAILSYIFSWYIFADIIVWKNLLIEKSLLSSLVSRKDHQIPSYVHTFRFGISKFVALRGNNFDREDSWGLNWICKLKNIKLANEWCWKVRVQPGPKNLSK